MKRILTLGIVLLTVNSLLPAQEITFSETKFYAKLYCRSLSF